MNELKSALFAFTPGTSVHPDVAGKVIQLCQEGADALAAKVQDILDEEAGAAPEGGGQTRIIIITTPPPG